MELPVAFIRETLGTGKLRRHSLGNCLVEVRNGVGADWSKSPVLDATHDGLAPAKEGVGKAPEQYKLVAPVTVLYTPMRIILGSTATVKVFDVQLVATLFGNGVTKLYTFNRRGFGPSRSLRC